MKNIFILILIGLLNCSMALATNSKNCLECHAEWEEEDGPTHLFSKDIHFQKGLGCVECHGGDTEAEDMDGVRSAKNYRGVPKFNEVPNFCARCHSDATYMRQHNPSLPVDQLSKYKTSVHGQRLSKHKDKKVATCISCHTVHQIGDGKLPHSSTHPLNVPETCGKCHSNKDYMAEYGIATNQLDDFKASVHGHALLVNKDLGAPACNDCHSNHGAAPPGVDNLALVCGNCHAIESELFLKSPHMKAYAENDFPMCATCHSNHRIEHPSDKMIGSTEPGICADCHDHDDGTRGSQTADSVRNAINALVAAHEAALTVLKDAQAKGMMTTNEEFLLKEVDQSLIQTRTHIHSFDASVVVPKAEEGIAKADSVKVKSAELIDEYYFRRKGLGGATLVITFLAILLYLRIRRIEKPKG
ncbi:MAG: cytochrome c3 family protein [candidate division Zixibacteria bacterium]|nr:cytochrome c3 family protein [candidate division Zixibacteria bacterium]